MTLSEIKEIPADSNGIIDIEIDGKKRRFVKEVFIKAWQNNPQMPPAKKLREFVKKSKKEPVKKNPVGDHRKKPIVVIHPDGTEQPFNSSTEAATALNLDRSNMPHVLSGRCHYIKGFKLKYQTT